MKGLILVYLLAIGGGLLAFKRPAIGLLVYVGFSVLRPHYLWGWAGDLSGLSDIVAIPMILGWIGHQFGRWEFGRGRPIVISLGLFTLWAALSSFSAVAPEVSFAAVLNLGKTLLPLLIGITTIDSERLVKQMIWVIVGCQAYVGFELNMSYLSGFNRAAYEGYGSMDSNSYGISLISTIGPAMALTLWARNWKERGIAAVCTLLILHTTLLTFSRGAMIGLITVGICAFLLLPKRPQYLLAAVAVALITLRLVGPELMTRYESSFADEETRDASAQSRVELWKACITVIEANPLFGVGFKNFGFVAGNYGFTEGKEAHTTWLQVTAEVGIIGGLSLLSGYLWTVVRLWPMSRRTRTRPVPMEAALAFGIILSIIGYCVSAQFVTLEGLETPYYMAMLAVVLLKRDGLASNAAPASERPAPLVPSFAGVVPVRPAPRLPRLDAPGAPRLLDRTS